MDDLLKIAQIMEENAVVKLVEVQKLSLEPDEILVVRYPEDTHRSEINNVGMNIARMLGVPVSKLIAVPCGYEFQKIKAGSVPDNGDKNGPT